MIYLDNAATTSLYPEVQQAMIKHIQSDYFGNPSSIHGSGRKAKSIIENAREVVAESMQANPSEIVFTGSGTESINSAIIGIALANKDRGRHIITSSVEHHAVLHTCNYLENFGWQVTYLPVDSEGRVDPLHIEASIREDTVLVSIMYVNNEVGVIQPIEEIADVILQANKRSHKNIVFHSDVVQAYGKLPINLQSLPVDLISVSAHKIHGPKGIGALYVKQKLAWDPYVHGGNQERGRRAGTENVLGIVGFAKAVEITYNHFQENNAYIEKLKNTFLENVSKKLSIHDWHLTSASHSVSSIVNISFPGVDAESLLIGLDLASIACSHGSACTSGSLEPSHVLKAMNRTDESIVSAIRFSFSYANTLKEIDTAAETVAKLVKKMQKYR